MFCSKQALKMCLIQNKILSNSFVFFFYHITINHFLEMIGSLISNFTDFRGKSNSFLLNHAFYMNLCILFVIPFSCCWNTYSAGFCLFVYLFLVSLYFFCLFVSTTDNNRTANTISEIQEICYNLRQCFRKDKIIKENVGDRGGITQKSNKMSAIEWSLHIKYTL